MKTILRILTFVGLVGFGLGAKPAHAQVSFGVATPGFALGVGPGAGYIAGGGYPVYPGYPVVVPRPVVVAPPPVFVQRPYGYGYGYAPRPYPVGYRGGYYGPHRGYPGPYRR